ncbi:MAG TPA: pyruvate formate lyase family protein [Symbiobacteriaceae bacterium]|nr:pyruvate formate lyase family protein [Symbiobacteriaceae bacterium]
MMDFTTEINFTETHRRYHDAHPALREVMCLRAQFPGFLRPIEADDLFAGRIRYGVAGFSPQESAVGLGYYYKPEYMNELLAKSEVHPAQDEAFREMLAYWAVESTAVKVRAAYPPHMKAALPTDEWVHDPGIAFPLYRMTGGYLDFDKLVQLGLPGLKAEITAHRAQRGDDAEAVQLYDAMLLALDLVAEMCLWYAAQAEALAGEAAASPERRAELQAMAQVLRKVAVSKPETFREAIQLVWLYVILAGHRNYGRMDIYLGDLLAAELNGGRLTEAEALCLTQSFWRLIAARKFMFDGRVIVGGKGRRNPENADRFALIAMEATRTVLEVEPQLTLRWHTGMNPALWEKALTVIGEGRTFPMIYNDDVNVPAVARAFDVSLEMAERYVPFSCGEYVLDHASYGSPNSVINLLKALEAALHNGRDSLTGVKIGLETGPVESFATFDQLWEAYKQQVEFYVEMMAEQEALEYRVAGSEAPFLLTSMLYDDCIGRGRGIFSGGIRYLGGTIETYGNTNTADSLTAIKQVVFDQKALTLPELVKVLDANFAGHETVRRQLLAAPKYGNDDSVADAMAVAIHEHVCNHVRKQRERTDLHSYLVVIINNSANTVLGKNAAASADGRKARESMANANNPAPGADKKGVTAMLNSLVKLDPSLHAGAVQNMKFSREMFGARRPQLEALLDTYFAQGGAQAMITVVSRGELEAAMREPEKYQNLFVRVGGFSARFVRMEPEVQREVLARTLY